MGSSKDQVHTNKIISRKAKARWADPEFKRKTCNAMWQANKDPKLRAKRQKSVKLYYTLHPEECKAISKRVSAHYAALKKNSKHRIHFCDCGCLQETKGGNYLQGHHFRTFNLENSLPKKNTIHICKCGCGKECNSTFSPGHGFGYQLKINQDLRERVSTAQKACWTKTRRKEAAERQSLLASERWNDPEFYGMMQDKIEELYKDPNYKSEARAANTKRLKKLWEDPVYRVKMSDMARENHKDPDYRAKMHVPDRFETGWIKTKKGGRIFWRGGWEKFFIEILDTSSLVKCFAWEPFAIPYRFDHRDRNYYPDVLITKKSGEKWLVELKGEKRPETEAKIKAARKFCKREGYGYNIIYEKPTKPLTEYLQ